MVVWKVKGLYKADAEKVYSEITALCRSAHLSQHFQSRRSSNCVIWPVHSSVSAREEAKAMADSMLRR